MKKRFFKRLSLVLALAMVLSVVSPAAGALAKQGPSLNSVKKYLHLGREETDANWFNFNINNKKSGWKYEWKSADESVATVKKTNGVTTAVGVGRTKVTVYITDKDGNDVTELTAEVIVRDNIKEVTINNPIPGDTLAVGERHNFNRDFVTEAGRTDKTSAITRWTIEPAEGVELNANNGVVVPQEAGEYTVTAWSFQSKARYNKWLKDPVKYADQVLDTDTCTFTVGNEMKEVKQKNLSKVDVTFSSPMTKDEVKKNIYVNYMIGDVAIKEQAIKDVEMFDNGLKAAVEIYDTFVPEVTYKVTYTDMEPQSFVAATTNPEDVVSINITTTTAKIYEDTTIKYELKDANGVVINQPVDVSSLGSRVTFENSNEYTSLLGDKLMIFNKGDSTTVTATYHTYDHDDKGNERVYKDSQLIFGVEENAVVASNILAWTITTDGPDFDDVNPFIAAGDLGRRLYVKLKLSDDTEISSNDAAYVDLIKLTSSDSSVLFVDEIGYLVPVKQGSVRVTVEYDDKYVGAFEVVVNAERKATRLSVDKTYYANVSNSKDFDLPWTDKQTVKVDLLDQYGHKIVDNLAYTPNLTIKSLSAKARADLADFEGERVLGDTNEYTFDPGEKEAGKYQYLLYDSAYPALTGQVTFDVKDPVERDKATSWKVEFKGLNDDGNVDVVVKEAAHANKTFTVELMAYARNGIKLGPVDLASYNVVIKDSKGKAIVAEAETATNSVYNATWIASGSAVSGGAIEKLDTGRYTVDILDGTTVKARGVLLVVDSQTLPKVSPKTFRSDETDARDAFADCFTVKIGDTEITDATKFDPRFHRTTVPTRAYAKNVFVREDIGTSGLYIVHDVSVGYYITVPVDFDGYSN